MDLTDDCTLRIQYDAYFLLCQQTPFLLQALPAHQLGHHGEEHAQQAETEAEAGASGEVQGEGAEEAQGHAASCRREGGRRQ